MPEEQPRLVIDAISFEMGETSPYATRVEQGGLVHRFVRYSERRAVWEFHCGDFYIGNAHHQYETFDMLTCVACAVNEPWFRRS